MSLVCISMGVSIPALTVCRLTLNLQGLSFGSDLQEHVEESELGVFTSIPTELRTAPSTATTWLNVREWGRLHVPFDDPVQEGHGG